MKWYKDCGQESARAVIRELNWNKLFGMTNDRITYRNIASTVRQAKSGVMVTEISRRIQISESGRHRYLNWHRRPRPANRLL